MTQGETRALVARFLDAFNAGDSAAMLALVSEDVVHDINQGGREIGKEKLRWFLATRARHLREEIGDVVVMSEEAGARAAAEFSLRGTYLSTMQGLPEATGQHYALAAGCFLEIDDGLIARVSVHFNRAGWIEQLKAN